ncbi:hypothetical protein [Vreelandella sulfidaeris]|uniref:hypothetical protein n=1 Tax=Vreelandella sulfidaeris TaxID=115553 RepID=UPI0035EECB64
MRLPKTNHDFIFHMVVLATWLCGLAIVNQQSYGPIVIIFPYLIPVVLVTWGYGIKWGFITAAFATFSSMPFTYIGDYSEVDMVYASIVTYAKLTGAAIGISLSRRIHNNYM